MGNILKSIEQNRVNKARNKIAETIAEIKKKIDDIELKKKHIIDMAQRERREGKPYSARNRLKFAGQLQASAEKLSNIEMNLVTINTSLENSQFMKEIAGTFRIALGALSSLSSKNTLEDIRRASDELDDLMDKEEELQRALETTGDRIIGVTHEELEAELKMLTIESNEYATDVILTEENANISPRIAIHQEDKKPLLT